MWLILLVRKYKVSVVAYEGIQDGGELAETRIREKKGKLNADVLLHLILCV